MRPLREVLITILMNFRTQRTQRAQRLHGLLRWRWSVAASREENAEVKDPLNPPKGGEELEAEGGGGCHIGCRFLLTVHPSTTQRSRLRVSLVMFAPIFTISLPSTAKGKA